MSGGGAIVKTFSSVPPKAISSEPPPKPLNFFSKIKKKVWRGEGGQSEGLTRWRINSKSLKRIDDGDRVPVEGHWRNVKSVTISGKPIAIPLIECPLHQQVVEELLNGPTENRAIRIMKFYSGPDQLKGMNKDLWPNALRSGLSMETRALGMLLDARGQKGGAFLAPGCGIGRTLTHVYMDGQGKPWTIYDSFNSVVGLDYSILSLEKAVKRIVQLGPKVLRVLPEKRPGDSVGAHLVNPHKISIAAARKTRFIWGDATKLDKYGLTDMCMFAITFNTFANWPTNDAILIIRNLRAVMKEYDLDKKIVPLGFITVYPDTPETKEMQIELYQNMGMRIDELGEKHVYASFPAGGGQLISRRFKPEVLRKRLELGGMYVLDIHNLGPNMLGAYVIPLKSDKPADWHAERAELDSNKNALLNWTGVEKISKICGQQ